MTPSKQHRQCLRDRGFPDWALDRLSRASLAFLTNADPEQVTQLRNLVLELAAPPKPSISAAYLIRSGLSFETVGGMTNEMRDDWAEYFNTVGGLHV
jgi:hypothetical protein